MWEWLYQECLKIIKRYNLAKEDKDDIVQEVLLSLFDCPDNAENIYNNRATGGYGLLKKHIKYSVFAHNAAKYFDTSKVDYFAYLEVLNICQQYNIQPTPENAYKIAPLMNGLRNYSTIPSIEHLLYSVKPCVMSLDDLIDSGVNV